MLTFEGKSKLGDFKITVHADSPQDARYKVARAYRRTFSKWKPIQSLLYEIAVRRVDNW